MYIDPMVALNEYHEHVREAEQHIARLRALEERRAAKRQTEPKPARALGILRRLLPRHGA